jgi:hypothetical protein
MTINVDVDLDKQQFKKITEKSLARFFSDQNNS